MTAGQVTVPLTVGQLAARAAVRTDTIRYYEREGLLPAPRRTDGEHRRYGPADLDGCCSSAAPSGSGCGWPRSANCSPSATPGPARASPPRSCCGGTSPRSAPRSSGSQRCAPNYSPCWPPSPARTAPTRCPVLGVPGPDHREGGDRDVPVLRHQHLRRLMLRRRMRLLLS